jgi:hypothetical protein
MGVLEKKNRRDEMSCLNASLNLGSKQDQIHFYSIPIDCPNDLADFPE